MAAVVEEKGIDIPPYFLCPISLPVTLPTGITYDRDDIEKWLFPAGKTKEAPTCPVTKQPIIPGTELTPNHTLRRLIQAWCVANASHGVERFPTPRAPVDRSHVEHLLNQARDPATRMGALRKLRSVAAESERNRRCVEATGAPDILVSVIRSSGSPAPCEEEDGREESTSCSGGGDAEEETLCILHYLQISQKGFCNLIIRNSDLVELLTAVLQRSNYQSRAYATFLLRSVFEAVSPSRQLVLKPELFRELVKVLRDQISYKTTKTALRILAQVCPWGKNRVRAADAGGVPVLVELCEMALVVLDQLCGCAEGRAELLSHLAGLAVLRVSLPGTERAVRVTRSRLTLVALLVLSLRLLFSKGTMVFKDPLPAPRYCPPHRRGRCVTPVRPCRGNRTPEGREVTIWKRDEGCAPRYCPPHRREPMVYAGPSFSTSPPPSSLPLPTSFSTSPPPSSLPLPTSLLTKRMRPEQTKELRYLVRLDLP